MSRLLRLSTTMTVGLAIPVFAHGFAQDKGVATTTVIFQTTVEATAGDEPKKAQNADEVKKAAADAKRTDIIAKAYRVVQKKLAERLQADLLMIDRFVAVGNVNLGNADLDPMAAQWLQQFTPMVRTELHFLLSVSGATVEQRKTIVAFRTKAAKDASKLYAQSQQRVGRFQNSDKYPQPRAIVQDCLLTMAATVLSPEQIELYKAEVKKRGEDHKSLAVKNIVAKMDQDLVLSSDQREKFETALTKGWQDSWCQSLESFMYGDQYFPAIPDKLVVPILNPKQATVWKSAQRNNNSRFGGFGFMNGMEVDDDFPDDEKIGELKKVADINMVPLARDLGQAVRRLLPGMVPAVRILAAPLAAPPQVAMPMLKINAIKVRKVVKDAPKAVPKS